MKKLLLLIISLTMLTGCLEIMPVKHNFPDMPPILQKGCPELQEAAKDAKELSKLLDTVVVNYTTYYECRIKIDAWLEWHKEQKRIFETLK